MVSLKKQVAYFTISAVATHKFVISFCVGLELYQAKTRLAIYSAYMAVYALFSPLGIGIGIAISTQSSTGNVYLITVAVLQLSLIHI